jgi:hypothetical protein
MMSYFAAVPGLQLSFTTFTCPLIAPSISLSGGAIIRHRHHTIDNRSRTPARVKWSNASLAPGRAGSLAFARACKRIDVKHIKIKPCTPFAAPVAPRESRLLN